MDSDAAFRIHCNTAAILNATSSRINMLCGAIFFFQDLLNVCGDSLGFGRERRMSQGFCTSQRSFFQLFFRIRCTSQLTPPIFKSRSTSRCFSSVCCCLYREWNMNDSVLLLNFPLSKMRCLDSLRFGRLCSLFSASMFFSSLLCFCLSAALLSVCEAFTTETLIAIRLCCTLKASRPLPSGHDRITNGFVRVFAFLQVFRRGLPCSPSSFLLLSSFLLWSLRTSHQAITPSHHNSIFPLPLLPWPGGMREAINKTVLNH